MVWLVLFALISLACGQEEIPKIILDAENVYGFPEQFSFLRVTTNNILGARYSWLKDGKKITKESRPSFLASDQTSLVPSDVKKDSIHYSGIYQFVMTTTAGTIKGRKITVDFTYVGKFDPSFPKDYNVDVVVGQANFIKCPKHQPGSNVIYKWGKQTSASGTKFMEPKPNYIVLDDGTLFYSHLTDDNVRQFNKNGWKCGMEAKSEGSNRFGWADLVITQMKVNNTNTTEFGPSIVTMLPKNYQFQEGDTISMKCAAKGRPTPKYSWKRVDVYNKTFLVKDGEDGITFDDGDARLLVIKKATRDHAGHYFCTATIGDKNDTVVGFLSFEVKPQWVVEDMKSVQPSIYSRHSWTCNATGFPKPTYTWHKDGGDLISSNKHVIDGGTITFPSLEKEDTGMYQCVADNGHDNIYQSAYLDVQAEKPVFDTNTEKTTLFLGGKGVIKCHAKAAPKAKNTWRKDGVVIDFSLFRYKLVNDEDLVIDVVSKSDVGNYTCKATNQYGEDSMKISVQVVGEITFIEEPESVNTTRGKQIKLKCKAKGDTDSRTKATIKYKWTYNGKAIALNDTIIWSEPTNTLYFLTAQVSQSGDYECIAYIDKPSYAEKKRAAKVVIQGPPEAPNKVKIDGDCSSFSAKLMWHVTDSNYEPVKYFIIQMMTSYDGPSSPWRNISGNVPAVTDEKTIGNLSPYTKYRFRVLAINIIGTSAPSEPTLFDNCKTPQRAPSKCPKIKGTPGKENELELEWEKMDLIDQNGKYFNYSLVYSSSNPKSTSDPVEFKPYELKFKIPNAGYYRPWSFKIQGVNEVGSGPFCHGDSYSGQSAPSSKPLDFAVKEFGSSYFVLHWKEITLSRGSVDGYKLTYHPKSSSKSRRSISGENCNKDKPCIRDIDGGGSTSVKLEGLIPYTDYRLALVGYNSGGLGPESAIIAKTEEGTPGVPEGFKGTAYAKFIKLEWTPPQRPNGIVTGYNVSVDKDSIPRHDIVDGTVREYLFGGLTAGKKYIISIRARTKKGFGEKESLQITTKAKEIIPAKPAVPMLDGVGENSVNVTFKEGKPEKGFPEKFIVLYRVKGGENKTWTPYGPVELFGPGSKPYVQINGLAKEKEYEMATVAVNRKGRSDMSDIQTVQPGGNIEGNRPKAHSNPVYKRSWFVAIVVVVCLLLIILLIALLITRKRGERYPVGKREKKRAGILDVGEEPDYGGYPMKPSRPNGNGVNRQNSNASHPNKDPERDSLDAYEEDRFDEDAASLIGAYNDDRKPNKTVDEPEFV